MKKIFLMAYVRKNLGDDLFIQMLTSKYKDCNFYMNVDRTTYIDYLQSIPNLTINVVDDLKDALYNSDVSIYDAYVYIGGSIFIEPKNKTLYFNNFNEFIEKCKAYGKPFYYISCNFGPYSSNWYLDYSRKIFEVSKDVCFRDKYSYNLFKDISSVRYAPDFIFNYQAPQGNIIKNSIGISVIDLAIRQTDEYLNFLTTNISNYLQENKQVYLYSFCEYEGDERTIDAIMKNFSGNKNIHAVKYDGNWDKFLELYTKMEYALCTRFHSFVLSSVCKQKIYVVSYSSKIDNVLEDLNFDLPVIHIGDVSRKVLKLEDFKAINVKSLNNAIELEKEQTMAFNKFTKGHIY